MSEKESFSLTLEHIDGFEFQARFDWSYLSPLVLDEPEPIGHKKGEKPPRVSRCLELFEDYCVVTGSIREAIEVNVLVTDPQGSTLM